MRLPNPRNVVRLLGQTQAAIQLALAAVPQLAQLLRELNALAIEAREFVAEAKFTQQEALALVAAVEITRREVQEVTHNAANTDAKAAAAVGRVTALIGEVESLVNRFRPALEQFAPIVDYAANEITVDDAEAFTALIHNAPDLVDKLNNQVVPVLDSLDTVGSDLREVMDNTQQMDQMLGAVPGLGRVKKRIEREQAPPAPATPPVTAPTEP